MNEYRIGTFWGPIQITYNISRIRVYNKGNEPYLTIYVFNVIYITHDKRSFETCILKLISNILQ